MRHVSAPIPTLREGSLGIEFPDAVERVAAKLLAKNPSDRYQSCLDVISDLELVQRGDFERVSNSQAPLRRPYMSGERALIMAGAVVAVACATICGVVMDRFMTQGRGPLPGLKLDVEMYPTQRAEGNSDRGVTNRLPSVFKYYSNEQTEDDRKRGYHLVFNFPDLQQPSLGTIHYWQGKDISVPAQGTRVFPLKAQLILEAADPNLPPCAFAHFCPNDLCGIEMKSPFRDISADDDFAQICQLDGLRVLVAGAGMSAKSLERIGELQNLRWLGLRGCRVSLNHGIRNRLIVDSDLASMPNLGNLRVLELASVGSQTQVLRRLARSPRLKRLYLCSFSALTDEDLNLLASINTLDTMHLEGAGVLQLDRLFDHLASLPRLENLSLYASWITPEGAHGLKKLKCLRRLSVECTQEQQGEVVRKRILPWLPAGFDKAHLEIVMPSARPKAASWFEPTQEDLVRSGIVDKPNDL
jgi:hypothetical protein